MKISQRVIRLLCLFGLWLGLGLQAHAQTDTVTYVYTDPQGTPLAEADTSGNVIARYDYTPYGNAVTSLGNPPNGPGYTGHVNDPETGLVYMQARYYQPDGRFLSPDQMEPSAGNIYSFNRYDYANNNPVINIDPNGRNAIISYNRDGSINISVPIKFAGAGASNPATIAAIKSDVASRWSGVYNVAGELTKVNVAITDVTPSTPKGAINTVTLTDGPTSDKATQGASFVSGDHVSGEWNVLSSGAGEGEFAHETGHLMGDKDYYTNGTDSSGKRTTTADPGYGNNLMAALGNSVFTDSRNMDVILHSPINIEQNPTPQRPPPPPPTQPNQ